MTGPGAAKGGIFWKLFFSLERFAIDNYHKRKDGNLIMKTFSKLFMVLMVGVLMFAAGCSNDEKAMVDAVTNGDTAQVQSLLDKGVSPNLEAEDGKTILMLAAYQGDTDTAKVLIDKGADVNAKDSSGKTALMYAAEKGNLEMVKLLLAKGADINATDNSGKTALQIAKDNNQTQVANILSNWGKPVATPAPDPEPAPAPAPAPAPVVSSNSQKNQILKPVFFALDNSTIQNNQNSTLNDNLALLKENPKLYVILGGHADERGSQQYNLDLAAKRTQAVKDYLVTQGIARDRIIIYSYGEDNPVKFEHNENAWQYNRRVDMLVWESVLSKDQVISETVK